MRKKHVAVLVALVAVGIAAAVGAQVWQAHRYPHVLGSNVCALAPDDVLQNLVPGAAGRGSDFPPDYRYRNTGTCAVWRKDGERYLVFEVYQEIPDPSYPSHIVGRLDQNCAGRWSAPVTVETDGSMDRSCAGTVPVTGGKRLVFGGLLGMRVVFIEYDPGDSAGDATLVRQLAAEVLHAQPV